MQQKVKHKRPSTPFYASARRDHLLPDGTKSVFNHFSNNIANYNHDLVLLEGLEKIMIWKRSPALELIKPHYVEKKFAVSDSNKEILYTIEESTESFNRHDLGKKRSWKFHMINSNFKDLIQISRASSSRFFNFLNVFQNINVTAGPDNHVI